MRALFDVNVLIALLDEQHIHHWIAHDWWAANRSTGWATCPLTENGLARIMSLPSYENPITVTFAVDMLAEQVERTDHAFWPDDISLRDFDWIDPGRILGPNQITDTYLLALSIKNRGRLVTLDRGIAVLAETDVQREHLVVIG